MKHLAPRRLIFHPPSVAELVESTEGGRRPDRQMTESTDEDQPDRASFSQIEQDLLKDDPDPVTMLSVLMAGISLFTYSADLASSTVSCYWLYDTGRWWWYLSIVPLVISLLLVNVFSIRWYLHDHHEEKDHLPPVSPSHWVMRGMFHVTLIGPLIRYAELFLYGVHTCDKKDPNRTQYRLMFLQEDSDISLLTLVGSFVKSAPQLVLQMYILTQSRIPINLPTTRSQAVNLVSSLIELSLAQCNYQRALRRSTPLKHDMTRLGSFVHFLSHCGVIASRVLALAAFATEYRHWVLAFAAGHWTLMTIWLIIQRTDVCSAASGRPRPFEEIVFNAVAGVIYIFCFVNVKDEPTRWKYTTYYIIIWIENVTLTTLWFVKADPDLWFRIPLMSSVIISLAAGLILLGVYYQYLHPNKIWQRMHQ